jgi:hypothetical protein
MVEIELKWLRGGAFVIVGVSASLNIRVGTSFVIDYHRNRHYHLDC